MFTWNDRLTFDVDLEQQIGRDLAQPPVLGCQLVGELVFSCVLVVLLAQGDPPSVRTRALADQHRRLSGTSPDADPANGRYRLIFGRAQSGKGVLPGLAGA